MEILNKKLSLMPASATVDEARYSELAALIRMCDTVASLSGRSIVLTDYIRKTLPFVSPNMQILCGYTKEEIQKMGYSLKKIVSPDDYEMIEEIVQMFWKFVHSLPEKQFRVSYDFHILHKSGKQILVNQKIAPILFADDGTPWVNMCMLNYSSRKEAGNVAFTLKNESLYYKYDFEKKEILPYTPKKPSRREEDIIRLSIQGYTEAEISEKLAMSIHTVRNHRYNIKRKLGTNNMANAVAMLGAMI